MFGHVLGAGIATKVLKELACSLHDEPWGIKGIVLNAISDPMQALLAKIHVDFSRGTSCITRGHFTLDETSQKMSLSPW